MVHLVILSVSPARDAHFQESALNKIVQNSLKISPKIVEFSTREIEEKTSKNTSKNVPKNHQKTFKNEAKKQA